MYTLNYRTGKCFFFALHLPKQPIYPKVNTYKIEMSFFRD